MSDQSGFRYLFHQSNLNAKQARLLVTISEFCFEIRYIKGKENRVTNALSRRIQVNHIAIMSSYGAVLHDKILQVGQQDVRYMELRHKLH